MSESQKPVIRAAQKDKAAAGETSRRTETTYVIYEVTSQGELHPFGEHTSKARTRKREVIKQYLASIGRNSDMQAVALPKADVEPIPVKASTVTVLEVG